MGAVQMEKIERHKQELLAYLKETPRISLGDAQRLLGLSESTVRRLFSRMESSGQALRVHGGLQMIVPAAAEYSYPSMEAQRLAQKKRIARAGIQEIGDARTLFLDSGSTVYQFSLCMTEWLRRNRREPISVFTNSVKNLQALSGLADIQFIGGRYRENRQDCCGYLAEQALSGLNFDVCILGADGCSVENGLSCTDMETARIGRIVVSRSRRKVVLADSSKFRANALATYAQAEEVDRIITDMEIAESVLCKAREKGVRIRTT